MANVQLFLQIWSEFLGIVAFLIGVKGYFFTPTPPGILVLGKTYPFKKEGDSEALLEDEEGVEYANVKSWSTRNAAIGLACIIAGIMESKDGYIMAFTLCAYREFFDVIELFNFEPKNKVSGTAFAFMGVIDFVALYLAIDL